MLFCLVRVGDFQLPDQSRQVLCQGVMQFARQALAFGEPRQLFNALGRGRQFEMGGLQFGVGTDLLYIQDDVCSRKQEQRGNIREVPDTIPPVHL